jgi:hypothetical protein
MALLVAVITSITIGGYAVVHGSGMFSPGGLSVLSGATLGGVTSHAAIGDKCDSCHAAPWAPSRMADRCLVCHVKIAAELADSHSLHARLQARGPSIACRACHPEHRGPSAALTDLDPRSFPHALLGFSLNTHQWLSASNPFKCSDCHTSGNYLGFSQDTCSNCHLQRDAAFLLGHRLAFGQDCTGCHDEHGPQVRPQ